MNIEDEMCEISYWWVQFRCFYMP